MPKIFLSLAMVVAMLALAPSSLRAEPIVIDFEQFVDSDTVGNPVAGIFFTNALVLTAGISLNELEFPPTSGVDVAFDDGGPMRIDFTVPIIGFSAFFTYVTPLTVQAFDGSNQLLASASSAFATNLALSGVPGSTPNELLSLSTLTNISYLVITGDAGGGSFTLEDATFQRTPVSEPGSLSMVLLGAAAFCGQRARRKRAN